MPMGAVWFVRGGGKVYGPLDSARLKQLVVDGKIDGRTEVAQSAAGPWNPAGNVKGLFPASGSAPKPPQPPPQDRGAEGVDGVSAPVAGNDSSRPQNATHRESFGNWYQRTAGGWNKAAQIAAWLCGGYVFFPLWWALSGNVPLLKVGKWVGIAFVALLALGAVMEFVDPEGMKQARERSAQAAAERREKANAEGNKKGGMKGAHVAAGLVAIEMKNNGAIRPRGDALNAIARQAANKMEVPSERRAEFVRDFEWAFNLTWDKSN
jgi:hypothetical protein